MRRPRMCSRLLPRAVEGLGVSKPRTQQLLTRAMHHSGRRRRDDQLGARPIAARLLFLSANASDRTPLAVDLEYNRVKCGLQTLGVWPEWRPAVEHVPAVAWEQVPEQLLLHDASIVHFAGHGYPDGSLEFSTRSGGNRQVHADGLAGLFAHYAGQVRLVVLNACYSNALADALTAHIDVVVGLRHAVADEAAILFALTF